MRTITLLLLSLVAAVAIASDGQGHSKHGSAFDTGMRTKPWVMEGIGDAPFPITSKNPEVQKWFDQGNSLLHSFWFEEAERSFRWCLKLDPDCAMAYWSLARCGFNWFSMAAPSFEGKEFDRYRTFLKEAVRRKDKVTERERMYIEAWEKATAPTTKDHVKTINSELQRIVIKFPNDIEAKAHLALFNIGQGSAFANELVIQQVLSKNKMHPGAHHASIHNWDGLSSEQAVRSCELYGKAAPNIGHALHMPGHIYSKIGMWHEAAIAMDSATRTELRYMNDRLALPFETWNYPHNRNYLCYIQEQLGMAEASLKGARDMLSAPRDPEFNSGPDGAIAYQGNQALVRALIKFERWEQIMAPGTIEWNDQRDDAKLEKAFVETLALTGLGERVEAGERLVDLKGLAIKVNESAKGFGDFFVNIAEGLFLLSQDKILDGQRALLNAADFEQKQRDAGEYQNDPPAQPWPIMRILGDDYRKRGENKLAIECYERALVNEPHDGFALSGLAQSHFALGNLAPAERFAGRLMAVWSQADPNLKWLVDVKKLGLAVKPVSETLEKERPYIPKDLDRFGPTNWTPFAAPKLEVRDVDSNPTNLEAFQGKNIILVFFLGDACVHCVGQLKSLNDRGPEFDTENTVILAVCSATPEVLKASPSLGQANIKFFADSNHENARRFASYDDFEDMELHSTILIDKEGKVRWKRTGGDPFMNIDFLLGELKRINAAK